MNLHDLNPATTTEKPTLEPTAVEATPSPTLLLSSTPSAILTAVNSDLDVHFAVLLIVAATRLPTNKHVPYCSSFLELLEVQIHEKRQRGSARIVDRKEALKEDCTLKEIRRSPFTRFNSFGLNIAAATNPTNIFAENYSCMSQNSPRNVSSTSDFVDSKHDWLLGSSSRWARAFVGCRCNEHPRKKGGGWKAGCAAWRGDAYEPIVTKEACQAAADWAGKPMQEELSDQSARAADFRKGVCNDAHFYQEYFS